MIVLRFPFIPVRAGPVCHKAGLCQINNAALDGNLLRFGVWARSRGRITRTRASAVGPEPHFRVQAAEFKTLQDPAQSWEVIKEENFKTGCLVFQSVTSLCRIPVNYVVALLWPLCPERLFVPSFARDPDHYDLRRVNELQPAFLQRGVN